MPTLILNRKEVRSLLDMRETMTAVEQVFRDLAEGRTQMPPKSYIVLERGDFRGMPVALPGAAGIKWVCVFPENPPKGLPTVIGTIIYSDPETGYPLAIMDATDLTAYRTGATSAIASKYLARNDSRSLGLVGAGSQSYTQLLAHAQIFQFEVIRIFDRTPSAVERFKSLMPGYPVQASPLEEAVGSDIVCTLTPSRQPFVKREWVRPGTHINAVGADAKGKEELDPSILTSSLVVVDDMEQATSGGEVNVPISKGLYREADISATLAEIITGKKKGRDSDSRVTVFDCTGLAIEDMAVARTVYERARSRKDLLTVDLADA